MSWLLVGCCGLALVSLSVAKLNLTLKQVPRFYGVKTGRRLLIHCSLSDQNLLEQVKWYKASHYDTVAEKRSQLTEGGNIVFEKKAKAVPSMHILGFKGVTIEDNGMYYCRINSTWGQGTELQVVKPINPKDAVYRNKVKDGFIILEVILLAICIVAPLIRNHTMSKKEESIYEEPEQDHIYEGLTIETCGGLYEEISVCGQAGEGAAPWRQDY